MRTLLLPTAGIFTGVGFAIGNAKNGFCGSVLRIWIGRIGSLPRTGMMPFIVTANAHSR